jgi:hypothetical protein
MADDSVADGAMDTAIVAGAGSPTGSACFGSGRELPPQGIDQRGRLFGRHRQSAQCH